MGLLENYSARSLSFQSDALNAVLGIFNPSGTSPTQQAVFGVSHSETMLLRVDGASVVCPYTGKTGGTELGDMGSQAGLLLHGKEKNVS